MAQRVFNEAMIALTKQMFNVEGEIRPIPRAARGTAGATAEGGDVMQEQLYRLLPLKWECHRPAGHEDGEWWTAATVFGMFMYQVTWEPSLGEYLWRHCVDEYYDEGNHTCDSIEDGKRQAERDYLNRILPALAEVPK